MPLPYPRRLSINTKKSLRIDPSTPAACAHDDRRKSFTEEAESLRSKNTASQGDPRARPYGVGAGVVRPGSGAGIGSLKFSGVSGGVGGVRVCWTTLEGSL
jgi:hypothetical protein